MYSTYDELGRSTLHDDDGTILTPEGATGFIGPNHTYSVFKSGAWVTLENPDPNAKFGFQPRATFDSAENVTGAGFTNFTKTIPSQGDPPQMFWVNADGTVGVPPGDVTARLGDARTLVALLAKVIG